jgi:hypothetical protein
LATWEYKVVRLPEGLTVGEVDFERHLNALGRDGWELVSVTSSEYSGTKAYLKRGEIA